MINDKLIHCFYEISNDYFVNDLLIFLINKNLLFACLGKWYISSWPNTPGISNNLSISIIHLTKYKLISKDYQIRPIRFVFEIAPIGLHKMIEIRLVEYELTLQKWGWLYRSFQKVFDTLSYIWSVFTLIAIVFSQIATTYNTHCY